MSKHCGQFIKCNNAEGCSGCEYEGEEDNKLTDKQIKKETIKTIKRHLKGIEKAVEKLEKE